MRENELRERRVETIDRVRNVTREGRVGTSVEMYGERLNERRSLVMARKRLRNAVGFQTTGTRRSEYKSCHCNALWRIFMWKRRNINATLLHFLISEGDCCGVHFSDDLRLDLHDHRHRVLRIHHCQRGR